MVEELEEKGLAASIPHAGDLTPPTRRYCLTAGGLLRLAENENAAVDDLLRSRPVSQQWRQVLLERLDALASLYRLASAAAAAAHPIDLKLYRAGPLDAALLLPGGRTVGVVRQGPTADRTAFAKRLWRLGQGPLPGVVLVLASGRGAAQARPPGAGPHPGQRPAGPGARRGAGRDCRPRLASGLRQRQPGPGLRPGPFAARRRTARGGTASQGDPPRRPSRGRPPRAARPAEAGGEARPGPAGRLALDPAAGPGGAAGRLGDPRLPAGESPGGVRPGDPLPRRRRPPWPSPTRGWPSWPGGTGPRWAWPAGGGA